LKGRDGGAGGLSGTAGAAGNGGGAGSGGGAPGGSGGGGNVGIGTGTAFPNGIGADWKWKTGVVAHTAGPYAPCGIIGTGPVTFGAANPTAPEFAAASRSGVVLFFSSETGKQVRSPHYVAGPVNGVDYSRDGTKLVVAGDTGVQIIRLADGQEIFNAQPFGFVARAAALSPDGSLIAALGLDSLPTTTSQVYILQLLRVSDGRSIAKTFVEAVDRVAPQFSPDGSLLVAAGPSILSVPSLEMAAPPPMGFYSTQTVLSPDGTKVAQGGHVIDLASGREVKAPRQGQGTASWAAFSPDGATYAEGFGATIHLWRVSDWTPIGTPTSIAFASDGSDITDGRFFFSGDGTRIISTLQGTAGDQRPVFQILNVPDLTRGAVIAEPALSPSLVVLSPDGSLITAGLWNSTTGVWRAADLSPVSRVAEGAYDCAFLGNGMLQIYSSAYNPLDGTRLGYAVGSGISPDGRLAVFSSPYPRSSVIRLADLTTQTVLESSTLAFPVGPNWAFSADNRFVAAAGADSHGDSKVMVFDAVTGSALATVAGAAPIAIATTPSGAVRVAAFVSETPFLGRVRVWSVPDGKALFDINDAVVVGYPMGATAVAFSPDGSSIAAGSDGIRIFQVETGALRETLPAHTDPFIPQLAQATGVGSLAFSATGQIVSVGWDGMMRLWCSP
jgi:WD40 repeat protein